MRQRIRIITRILYSFRIYAQELCVCSYSEEVEEYLRGIKISLGAQQERFLKTCITLLRKVSKIVAINDFVKQTLIFTECAMH